MATNPYINKRSRSEQGLYEDLVIESLQFYGEDVYYLPRELVNKDTIFGDDVVSRFTDAYKIEMYIENVEGFGGEGDLFSKFGVELRDQCTFVVARKRWKRLIGDKLDAVNFRPREGDIIYLPLSQSMFEIFKVETETPFYQLAQLPTFRLQCELFEYNDEDFDTEVDYIDIIEQEAAYQYKLKLMSADSSSPVISTEIDLAGSLTSINITSSPGGFETVPTVTISQVDSDNSKFGISSLNCSRGRGREGSYLINSAKGFSEFWVYTTSWPTTGQQALFLTGGNDDAQSDVRTIWGITYEGKLAYSTVDDNTVYTPGDTILSTGSWHHILVGVEDSVLDGDNPQILFVYVNGGRVYEANLGKTFNWVSNAGYSIGVPAARTTAGGVFWDAFNGWIDDFRTVAAARSVYLASRISGTTISLPNDEFDSDSNTAIYFDFNGRRATASAGIEEGRLVNLTITDSGEGYLRAPTISLTGLATDGTFERGEIVTQTGVGYTMQGEVVAWSDSDNYLYLNHVGADDGEYHSINTMYFIRGENGVYLPSLVEELENIQQGAQNEVFDNFESDFLDFSESNPFGDMS